MPRPPEKWYNSITAAGLRSSPGFQLSRKENAKIKYLKENWSAILISLFLVVVCILLLVNPSQFASVVLKLAGAVLILCRLWDLIKYFRADALFLNARKKTAPAVATVHLPG